MKIADALAKLDHANDEHWTADGAPALAALKDLTGRTITRRELSEAAPDFARRPVEATAPADSVSPAGEDPSPAETGTAKMSPEPKSDDKTLTAEEKRLLRVENQRARQESTPVAARPETTPEEVDQLQAARAAVRAARAKLEEAQAEMDRVLRIETSIVEALDAKAPPPHEKSQADIRRYLESQKAARRARAEKRAQIMATLGPSSAMSKLDESLRARRSRPPATAQG